METRKIFKCFISSPGDCSDERESCIEVIEKVNSGLAKHLGIGFETFMWEYDVLPDMGKNGQEIIDEYINKSNYDIFIGIMKSRFGQPTKKAGSGTEHEYNDALARKQKEKGLPSILFFFGKEHVDPDSFDFEQYGKVKEFKEKIKKDGIYIDFQNLTNFNSLLEEKLELFIKEHSPLDQATKKIQEVDLVLRRMEDDLNKALTVYNEKSPIWIEPILSTKRQVPNHPTKNDDHRVQIKDIIASPSDIVIKAPSEFGLSSLAHYIKLEAWKTGKTFLYLDSQKTKKHKVIKDITNELENYFFSSNNLDCILLDSVNFEQNGMMQIIKNICEHFINIPLIIFNTLDNKFFLKSDEDDKVEIKRPFISYYLLPLPQNEIRKIVTSYSKVKCLEEDHDVVLTKITKDLEILNIHRTAKNCISILRAHSKIGKHYTAVNRTKLLETILNTIFEDYDIPRYGDKKPDVKDCSFVLGYFCELLIQNKDFEFREDYFKSKLKEFCEHSFIDMDLNYLLDILVGNSIFSRKSTGLYYFKSAYWVFYFLAQRMNMSKDFLEFVYEHKIYIDYPEIMEFYTGIDRNKDDALRMLNDDLNETLTTVRSKVKIADNINPFKAISWKPDVSMLEKEQAKISENVISSGLPDEIKDRYDDKHYDQLKPYNQVINSVIRDYSFLVLMRQISASSRALRNSDFVDRNVKQELLDKIIRSWNEINKLLIVLCPLLADKGAATFEGAKFYLDEEDFNIEDPNEKRLSVLLALPSNVVNMFKDDLYSNKMGPLLIDKAEKENNSLLKHELMELLISERPKEWYKTIDKYIVSLDKNSFFLSEVLAALVFTKDYRATEVEDKRIIDMLAQKCRAKHIFKQNNPDIGLINQVRRL